MADPVQFKTGDPGARSRDNWNELSRLVQTVIDNADAILDAKDGVLPLKEQIDTAALQVEGDRQAAEDAAATATQKAEAFASQLATMSAQILAIQTIVAEHHGFGE